MNQGMNKYKSVWLNYYNNVIVFCIQVYVFNYGFNNTCNNDLVYNAEFEILSYEC